MTTGTPRFVGARLRQGREARGIAATALADVVAVSRQAISNYERGKDAPRADTMERIAQVLSLPIMFFQQPLAEQDPAVVFFRSLKSATGLARERGRARHQWLLQVVDYINEFIELPQVDLPDLNLPIEPSRISDEAIEDAARRTRQHWGLKYGPISNIVWLLENRGVIVARDQFATDSIDAFSGCVAGRPYMILGIDKGSAVRSRFDACHELGHLILHRNVPRAVIMSEHSLVEQQANRFSGAFLLPPASFCSDLPDPNLDDLRVLKQRWRVSIAAMIHRLGDLGILSADDLRRWWISYNRRGWRTREPLDGELAVEQPTLLRRSFELLIDDGGQTRAEITAALHLGEKDIEQLAGLPPGFLDEDRPPTPVLRMEPRPARAPLRSP